MSYLVLLAMLAELAGNLAVGGQPDSTLWSASTIASAAVVEALPAEALRAADSLLGAPYHFGGGGPGRCPTGEHPVCTDCSGLVSFAYGAAGVTLPHSSAALESVGEGVARHDLAPGDILVFRTDGNPNAPADHTGIYVGHGLFIHAGSRGVRLDDLEGPYWGDPRCPRLRAIRRVAPPAGAASGSQKPPLKQNGPADGIPPGGGSPPDTRR